MKRALLFFIALPAAAQSTEWTLARSPHFEIYAQSPDQPARNLALWMEELRAIVERQTRLSLENRPPLRVIAFRSAADYDPYRVHTSADAYYVGSESRDFIVMASPEAFDIAAHEFAHAVLRSGGFDLPPWLREGLAEVFASIRITPRGGTIGGENSGRAQTLRQHSWIPLPQLLRLGTQHDLGPATAMFYAESWALADLVALAPGYAPRFPQFLVELMGGASTDRAFASIYGKSLDEVASDLSTRVAQRRRTPVHFPAPPATAPIESSAISGLRVRTILAEILLTTGDLDRAASLYRDLLREAPADPEVALGLAAISIQKGDSAAAHEDLARAMAGNAGDALLCYRYSLLASNAGAPAAEIRPALQRAVALDPGFDDARFSLALLESNAGHAAEAVTQLRSMHRIAPGRAYGYWNALADGLARLDRRDEAVAAAHNAEESAATDEERRHAADLAHIARTDLAVRMTRDADGRPHMVTTRVAHDDVEWNPFVEPGDRIERAAGTLREVDCSGSLLRVVLETAAGPLNLAIRRLDQVQIRNGPGEFTCGPQSPPAAVLIEYARRAGESISGDVRGIVFK